MQKSLRQSQSNLRQIVDLIPQSIFVKDYHNKFLFVNKSFAELYGLSPKQIVNKYTHEIAGNNFDASLFLEMEQEVIRTGVTKILPECAFIDHMGRKRIFYTVKVPYLHSGKNEKAILSIVMDITDQKKAEEERNEMIAHMVSRTKDLEQFSYIVSHNLRSPVSNIIGISDLLLMDQRDKMEENGLIPMLSNSAIKLDTVIKDLNTILQVKNELNETKVVVKFSELIADINISIDQLLKDQEITIISDFSAVDELFTIKSYLFSIFFNLISNSIKYRQPNIAPIIEVSSKLGPNTTELVFKDNCLGIDLKHKGDQIFGLYKRFHYHTEGKGMGLFMVKTQVETLNGRISVESEINKGTTFKIVFDNLESD